jgi:DNA/RNA-binding domain of Phe-tRNA-synthetase-like protein
MTDHRVDLAAFLSGASIDAAVAALRPDYRALLIAVDGFDPHTDKNGSEALLVRAEETARDLLAETPVEELPHVAAWREAYRAFGAKRQRTHNSLEALVRRAGAPESGLPRVNALTDLYNAISIIHQVPLGGEDLNAYVGAPRLVRATGAEAFDTVAGGEPVVEHPDAGEVVWCDDTSATCRRWNWRQAGAPSSPTKPPRRCSSSTLSSR